MTNMYSKRYRDKQKEIDISTKQWDESMLGKNNPMWKGDTASYTSLHDWVQRHKPKTVTCESCGKKKKLELSNISGEYKRDVNDYQWLCRSCHRKLDLPNHKPDCSCSPCRSKRGETKGTFNPFFGKHHTLKMKQKASLTRIGIKHPHAENCKCPFCKAKRGETKGINHPNWKGSL